MMAIISQFRVQMAGQGWIEGVQFHVLGGEELAVVGVDAPNSYHCGYMAAWYLKQDKRSFDVKPRICLASSNNRR